jgi:ubiquitin C-terminal hydrolase
MINNTTHNKNNVYYSSHPSNDPYIQQILNSLGNNNNNSNGLDNYQYFNGDSNPTKNNELINNNDYEKYFNTSNNNKVGVIGNGNLNNNLHDFDYLLTNNTTALSPKLQPSNNKKNNYNEVKNLNNNTLPNTIGNRPKFVEYDLDKIIKNQKINNVQEFINNNGNLINQPNNIINHNTNVPNNETVNMIDYNTLVNGPTTSPDTANKVYVTNYQNNSPKMANVVKIEGTALNIPNPTPVKKRPLNKSDYQKIIFKEIGIINLGNTCFINSCLQVLIHCPSFIYGFFSKDKLINKEKTPMSYYLYSICIHMMNTVNTQEKYIDISNFRYKFAEKHQTFGGFIQNDSQEFCRVLLEDLSNELNEVKEKAIYRTLTNSDKKQKIEKDVEFDKIFRERENSIIIDLFYAQLITSFTCQCKEETYSFQKILDFPLLLPENTQNIDIMNLLRNNFKPEEIDFEPKCQKCQKVLKHKKATKISRPPNILILSLQRVDEKTQNKNECVVTFPYILDIKEFIDPACGHIKENKYNLYAVINHQGSMDCGHYYSYIRFHGQKAWYLFNDSSVKKVEGIIQSFPYAYALFYIKQKNA